jgi:hypothetical protein
MKQKGGMESAVGRIAVHVASTATNMQKTRANLLIECCRHNYQPSPLRPVENKSDGQHRNHSIKIAY